MENKEMKIANYLMNEAEENEGVVTIYYSDLDIEARAKVIEAINNSGIADIMQDDLKPEMEAAFAKTPLFTISGKEITNLMNFGF